MRKGAKRKYLDICLAKKKKVVAKKRPTFQSLGKNRSLDNLVLPKKRAWQKREKKKKKKILEKKREAVKSYLKIDYLRLLKKSVFAGLIAFSTFMILFSGLSLVLSKDYLSEDFVSLGTSSLAHFNRAEIMLGKEHKFDKAAEEIESATLELKSAETVLVKKGQYCFLGDKIPYFNSQVSVAQRTIHLGLSLARTAKILANLSQNFVRSQGGSLDFIKKVKAATSQIERGREELKLARIDLNFLKKERSVISEEKIKTIEEKLNQLDKITDFSKDLSTFLPELMGEKGKKRYLLLFLNNREMRPGGGYIGSFAVLELAHGNLLPPEVINSHVYRFLLKDKIKKTKENYDQYLEGLPDDLVYPPTIGRLKASELDIAESNWSLDFEKNARRAMEIYENFYEQGSVDGVLAFNPKIVEDLLSVVGEIELPEQGTKVNSENFRDVVEHKVEIDNPYRRGEKNYNPKQILSDLSPKLILAFSKLEREKQIEFFEMLLRDLKEKEILLYSKEDKIESLIKDFGFAGNFPLVEGKDFLSLFFTNTTSRKSSLNVKKYISLQSEILAAGRIKHKLNLVATHRGSYKFPDGCDGNLVQLVVPKGSTLDKFAIEGKDFSDSVSSFIEDGKKVFLFSFKVCPGEAKNLTFSYESGYRFNSADERYNLEFVKQPGLAEIDLDFDIRLQRKADLILPEEVTKIGENHFIYKTDLSFDREMSLIFKK